MADRTNGVEGATQTPVPTGLIQRVTQGINSAATSFALAMGWFPPGAPMPNTAPDGTDLRALDYQTFVNTTIQPRANELVTFRQMRLMADSYYLLRLAIETRKDQVAKLPWNISIIAKGTETGKAMRQKNATDPRVAALTAMLQYPDGEIPWDSWIASIVEELLVTDAVTINPRRGLIDLKNPDPNAPGPIMRLEQVDGATIKRVVGVDGRTPDAPTVAYQQVLHGQVASSHTTEDLIYFPRNRRINRIYGYSPVEQVILIVNLALRRFNHQMAFYTEGTVPEALVQCPNDWTHKDVKLFQVWFDQMLRGNSAKRRRVIFLPGGKTDGNGKSSITFTKEAVLKDEMDDYLSRVICFAFSLPPTALVKGMNRATAEEAQDTAKAEGLEPVTKYLENLMNFIIQSDTWFGYKDIQFRFTKDEEQDEAAQATVHDLYLRNGTMSIDEVRDAKGLDPIGADQPCIYSQDGTQMIPVVTAMETGERLQLAAADTAENPPPPPVAGGGFDKDGKPVPVPNNPGKPGGGKPDGNSKPGASAKPSKPANKNHASRGQRY